MSERGSAFEARSARPDRLAVFAWLWAVWAITEQAQWNDWVKGVPNLAFSCSALWLLVRPWSLAALGATALSQLVRTLWLLPWVSDHALFASFVSLALLLALAGRASGRAGTADRERLFDDLAAPIRLCVIALYGWAMFHKVNTGWFDAAGSCGAALYRGTAQLFGLPDAPAAVYALGVVTPLGIELAIPVLLMLRRTRDLGVLVLMLFHLSLAAPPTTFYRFSAAMFALGFLFWPADAVDRLTPAWDRLATQSARKALLHATRVALPVSMAVLAWQTDWTRGVRPLPFYRPLHTSDLSPVAALVGVGWAALAVAMIGVFVFFLRGRRGRASAAVAPIFAIRRPVLWIPVLLVVLNGVAPYLGVKTETSFAMFSNLRIEEGRTNHLLIERTAQLTDHAEDMVRILDATDPELALLAQHRHRIAFFELRDHLQRASADGREIRVTFERGGRIATLSGRDDLDRHVPAVHPLARKLLYHRSVPPEGVVPCGH